MATIIAPLVFPGDNTTAALLSVLAVFSSTFLIKPPGGIVLGRLIDQIDQRTILLTTVIGMGGATALIGALPTAAQAGFLLVLIRFTQSFFADAEIIGTAAFVSKSLDDGRPEASSARSFQLRWC